MVRNKITTQIKTSPSIYLTVEPSTQEYPNEYLFQTYIKSMFTLNIRPLANNAGSFFISTFQRKKHGYPSHFE